MDWRSQLSMVGARASTVAGQGPARAFFKGVFTCGGMMLAVISCEPECERDVQVGDELQIALVERTGGETACADTIGLREGVVLQATIRDFGGGDQECSAAKAEIHVPDGSTWELVGEVVGGTGDLLGSYRVTHESCSARVSLALAFAQPELRLWVSSSTCTDNCAVFYAVDVERP